MSAEPAARLSGELRRTLQAHGDGLATDSLIAGICPTQSAILLTRNTATSGASPD